MKPSPTSENRVIIFDFNRTLFDPDSRNLIEGARELLQFAADQGYLLVLLAQAAPSRQKHIDDLEIGQFMNEIMLVEHKTPAIFRGISLRHCADIERSWVIGDRAQREIATGQALGWQTIWYQSGKFAQELPQSQHLPTYTVHQLNEIHSLI